MIVLDVNVLVAAFVDSHERHEEARAFLRAALARGDVAVPDVVWSGFVRVVTNPIIVDPPAEWFEVRRFADGLRAQPGYRADIRGMSSPLESFLVLCQLCGAQRNLVSDAYIAAVAVDVGGAVATWDTDFDRLPALVIRPDSLT